MVFSSPSASEVGHAVPSGPPLCHDTLTVLTATTKAHRSNISPISPIRMKQPSYRSELLPNLQFHPTTHLTFPLPPKAQPSESSVLCLQVFCLSHISLGKSHPNHPPVHTSHDPLKSRLPPPAQAKPDSPCSPLHSPATPNSTHSQPITKPSLLLQNLTKTQAKLS